MEGGEGRVGGRRTGDCEVIQWNFSYISGHQWGRRKCPHLRGVLYLIDARVAYIELELERCPSFQGSEMKGSTAVVYFTSALTHTITPIHSQS